ncbi:acyl transferase/acyl hydrolase/lysophospholipase [Protomyces lactucae-debilis]|uniref:Lysophospholipase n=1 Tax=Protomyces lactucae-debilis TaxID=2754530 RepID=A0A1Y2FVY2_PROLT|nr:acyl transferase/acyl hydrolase/lysophospholipase [Protomyces lactucae-debilis]ORY86835.1 acyl transferase/acyl hydrolase/lysophospholipase [Protomyces lactucae-debilis]
MLRAWRNASIQQRRIALAATAIALPPSLIYIHSRALHLEADLQTPPTKLNIDHGGNQSPPKEQATKQLVSLLDIDWPFAKLADLSSGVFSGLGLPRYALLIPEVGQKVVAAFSFDEGSLGKEVIEEAHDLKRNPEMALTAEVRIGDGLCDEELAFLKKRRQFTRKALAKYIHVPESEIDERDIPVIGVAGSGGGLRACLATTCIYEVLQEEGLLGATTYLAGISGSTWAQALFMTLGNQDPTRVLAHLKRRITTHIASPVANLELLNDNALEKYLLRGVLERWYQGYKDIGLVDLYGLMLTGRFLLPNNELVVNDDHLKISSQRKVVETGAVPLPISSMVHHEVPVGQPQKVKERAVSQGQKDIEPEGKSYFQFFEVTPFEFGSEELSSWIPTWSLGRKFDKGKDVNKVPELKLTTLLGTFSSAFCASLSHYLAEVQPLLPKVGIFKLINEQILSHDEDFKSIHLVDASKVPNYVKGMRDQLPDTVPGHFNQDADLTLCDAGMSNNLPFYPLLRRDVDILIAIDSSADIEANPWFSRVEGYAKLRGVKGWPVGAGWPKAGDDAEAQLAEATASSTEEAKAKMSAAQKRKKFALSPVNIWVGQATKSEDPSSTDTNEYTAKQVEENAESVTDSTGLMLIYLPLLPNDEVAGIDPATSDFCSTWNFEWQPEQVDLLRDMTRANFATGKERIRRAVKAMWERKRKQRLSGEKIMGEQRSTP